MPFYNYHFYFFLLFSTIVFSQETIKHTVVKGETVYDLAQKYQVKQAEIFELNPKAKNGLQLKMVLNIPNKKQQVKKAEPKIHEVLPKETLYGIAKQYNISIEKIKEANPEIVSEGLKIGAKINIPLENKGVENFKKIESKKSKVDTKIENEAKNSTEEIIHEVQAKETKYGISKKYGVEISQLEELNPEIKNGLAIGYKLVIKKGISKEDKKVEVIKETPSKSVQIEKKNDSIKKEDKPKSQFKILEKVESVKNEEVIVKPQIEEEEEIKPEIPIEEDIEPLSEENLSKVDFLIEKASENIGVRYRSGGTTNAGFDCSGLMYNTFTQIDMKLPRSSREMASYGHRIERSKAEKGDLIFFATMGKGRVSHVGMIVEIIDDEIKFIHSSTSVGVIISSTKEPYYAKRFVQINRVLE